MSLFKRLTRFHSRTASFEDYFTEIFAHSLSTYPDLCCRWAADLLGTSPQEYDRVNVSTQYHMEGLSHHTIGSRPDMRIDLFRGPGNPKDLIFIENKIKAKEGHNQLRRYAEHLATRDDTRYRILCYITRDYDEKDGAQITKDIHLVVRFHQIRWYSVYDFLRDMHLDSSEESELLSETLELMKEFQMSRPGQFTASDILALQSFPRARVLMEETLLGEVKDRFDEVAGSSKQWFTASTQLQRSDRYILLHSWVGPSDWWCGLGYFLEGKGVTDYPQVGLILEVSPGLDANMRKPVVEFMRELHEGSADTEPWEQDELGDRNAWSKVMKRESLRKFLSREDHIPALEEYFLSLLDDLERLMSDRPDLPWN